MSLNDQSNQISLKLMRFDDAAVIEKPKRDERASKGEKSKDDEQIK